MKITDPVCGMTIDMESAAASVVFQGKTYHFCSDGCRDTFERNPEQYAAAADGEGPHGEHHRH